MNDFRKCPLILAEDEPDSFELMNPHGKARAVITCDHASNRIPRSLHQLGLSSEQLALHIAYDIGCSRVSQHLSELLDAPLIMGSYSRLVIDLNRHLDDQNSIPEISDGHKIAGNLELTKQEVLQRIESIFIPYHSTLAGMLEQKHDKNRAPAIIAVHSFTPVYQGYNRPWHYGILWDRDNRLAAPLIKWLSEKQLCVGENKPYHAREPVGYSMDVHAEERGFAHALIEIRQDLIEDEAGQVQAANVLGEALNEILIDSVIYKPHIS